MPRLRAAPGAPRARSDATHRCWPSPPSPAACTPTTRRSAPVPRIGTRPLTVSAAWGSPFHERPQARTAPLAARGRGTTGSHVPHRSPDQARAASMPDTARPAGRHPPRSSRDSGSAPVSMPSTQFRHVISGSLRSPSWPTPDALNGAPFPATLSTPAPSYRRTLRWLATSPARAAAEDHQPHGRPLHLQMQPASNSRTLHIALLQRSWSERRHAAATARTRAHADRRRQRLGLRRLRPGCGDHSHRHQPHLRRRDRLTQAPPRTRDDCRHRRRPAAAPSRGPRRSAAPIGVSQVDPLLAHAGHAAQQAQRVRHEPHPEPLAHRWRRRERKQPLNGDRLLLGVLLDSVAAVAAAQA